MHVSTIELFEHKNEEYFALGMRDGTAVIKPTGSVLSPNILCHIIPPTDSDEEAKELAQDKVTFIGYIFPSKIVFGSKEGRISFYDMAKKGKEDACFSFMLD